MITISRHKATQAALSVYPRTFRERYGAEVGDMLIRSTNPMRDLVDVAWCALIERGDLMTTDQIRLRAPRLATLVAAPFAFSAALLALASAAVLAIGTVDQGADQSLVQIAMASAVLPVIALALWMGDRVGRTGDVPVPSLVLPASSTLGIIILANIPIIGEALGERPVATTSATLLWCAGTSAVAIVGTRLHRRHRVAAAAVMTVGGVLALELCCIAYGSLLPAGAAPDSSPFWWYPTAVSGIGDSGTNAFEAFKGFPAVSTVMTAFVLSTVIRSSSRRLREVRLEY